MKNFLIILLVFAVFALSPRIAKAVEIPLLDNGKEIGTVTVKNESNLQLVSVASLFKALGLVAKSSDNNALCVRDKEGRSISFFDGTNVVRLLGEFLIAKRPVKYEKPHLWCDVQTAFTASQKFMAASGRKASLSLKNSTYYTPSLTRDTKKPITITTKSDNDVLLRTPPIESVPDTKTTNDAEKKLTPENNQSKSNSTKIEQSNQAIATIIPTSSSTSFYQPTKPIANKPKAQQKFVPAPATSQTTQKLIAAPEPKTQKETPSTNIPSLNKTPQKPIVVLDAGHGGNDPGAVANNVREKDIVLKAVHELAEILRNQGVDVRLTRSTDIYLKLSERTAIANKHNADVFVSLHCNSLAKKNSSVSGLEYYIMALPRDKDSMALAIAENKEIAGGSNVTSSAAITDKKTRVLLQILGDMQQNDKINESTTFAEYLYNASLTSGLKMRKVAQAPFFVLRGAAMPAVLAELGYLTNKEEAQKLTTFEYRQKLCNTIAHGIINYLNEHPTITE